ncbi:MAG: ABC transporter substrate-binding protein [Rickettsiales bacterium]
MIMRKLIFIAILLINTASLADEGVKKFINGVADRVISVAGNKSYSKKQKAAHMMEVMKSNFNIRWMSKFVLGSSYRDLNDKQKSTYYNSYQKYLLYSYLPNLLQYSNETFRIISVKEMGKKDCTVETEIIRHNGKPPIKLSYHVKKRSNGSYKVVDIIAEGISAILSQRSEFKEIIQQSGVNGLIDLIKNKNIQFDKDYA